MNNILQKQFFLNGNFTKKEKFDHFGKSYENKNVKTPTSFSLVYSQYGER